MKVLFITFLLLIVVCFVGLCTLWMFRTRVVAYYISRSLNNAPVSLTEFTYRDSAFFLENLSIKETSSRSDVLFRARGIALDVSIRDLMRTPLVIESIEISDISLYIEGYRNGSTNWDRLLSSPAKAEPGKPYLIQELVLKDLYVEMRRPDGRLQRFPVTTSPTRHAFRFTK